MNGDEIYAGGDSDTTTSWECNWRGTHSGGYEGYVLELKDGASPSCTWAQWLGGTGNDEVYTIAVNDTEVYAGGYTASGTSWEGSGSWNGTYSGNVEGFFIEILDDDSPPLWFDNSTNGSDAGTWIEHSVRWSDDINLSGYVFSIYNGSNTTFESDSGDLEGGTSGILAQSVEISNNTWASPDAFTDPDSAWSSESNAYDDNTGTGAGTSLGGGSVTSSYLILNLTTPIQSTKLRYYIRDQGTLSGINIDITDGGSWKNVKWGSPTTDYWANVSFSSQTVTAVRINISKNGGGGATYYYDELDVWNTSVTYNNDTDTNRTGTEYGNVVDDGYDNLTEINVTVYVSNYNSSGGGSGNPDLWLDVYNGTGWVDISAFGFTASGQNRSIVVTEPTVLEGWRTASNRGVIVRGIQLDYQNGSYRDEINWTGVWVKVDGESEFLNDSWAVFTGQNNWSNVTKYVSEQGGSTIKWRVYSNDTSDNWNATDEFSYEVSAEGGLLFWVHRNRHDGLQQQCGHKQRMQRSAPY